MESAGGSQIGFANDGQSPPVGIAAPLGMPVGGDPAQVPPAYLTGMTAPEYGMPRVGTPIGLPGPAHIPLGIPAGLKKHTITNHTRMHMPSPSQNMSLHVQQSPGLSYPKPATNAYVAERQNVPNIRLRQPREDRAQIIENCGPPANVAVVVGEGAEWDSNKPMAPLPPEPVE